MSEPFNIDMNLFGPDIGSVMARIGAALAGDRVSEVVMRAVKEEVREHLFQYGKTHPNQLGGKRTQFYGEAARTLEATHDPEGATISVTKVGIKQRLFGGPITAVNVKYLTIPAIAEAYGHRASDFWNLRFVKFGRGDDAPAGLVETNLGARDAYSNKRIKGQKKAARETGHKNRVFFWLKHSVMQGGDLNVMPTEVQVMTTAIDAVEKYAATHLEN